MSRAALAALAHRASLRSYLFPVQREAVFDPSPKRLWQCSRRSGKTTGAMLEFFEDGLRHQDREYAYIALTRVSAQRIAWNICRELKRLYCPSANMREALLRVELPTGSALTMYGADRPDWTDRLYGLKLGKVWIDEAAFYHSIDQRYLIDEILEPCVTDLRGSITLMSKPGYAPDDQSFFWRVSVGKEPGWAVRKWTWQDNPHMVQQTQELLDRETALDPTYLDRASTRRNWFNEWVSEDGERVYRYEKDRNGIDAIPWDRPPKDLTFVLGMDLGHVIDPTAFVVLAASREIPFIVELESHSETGMNLDQIAARVKYYEDHYPGLMIECDPDRRVAFDELRRRYELPLYPANKTDKRYWIDQFNTDLASAKIRIIEPHKSQHATEMERLTWMRRPGSGKVIERPGQPNDCCDAALYAYRRLTLHKYEPSSASEPPRAGTRAHSELVDQRIQDHLEAQLLRGQTPDEDY